MSFIELLLLLLWMKLLLEKGAQQLDRLWLLQKKVLAKKKEN
jgi:hypothetical protein